MNPAVLIVADVGGTYARVALVSVRRGGSPEILGYHKYACAEHPDLASILRRFIDEKTDGGIRAAVVAIAGVLDGDTLVNANLPWPVSLERTRQAAALQGLHLINDFEAVAYAIPHLQVGGLLPLTGEQPHHFQWPALVLGPGTGLGAALRFEGGERPVLASEVGHSALAPANELEMDILRRLMKRWPHVDNERVLSGSGLMNLYPCLCEIRGSAPRWQTPEQLIAAANAGQDALAVETLQVFCGWLGSLIGDLVIAFGARSVYLAGGIPAHIENFLRAPAFRERYFNKGVLGHVLRHVPIWRVDHGQLGIVGAAAWFADQPARD
ncbi:glucokinase [Pseudoxanthomonas indica]|uniref:Glucokinase n=1 Tax=Pseudoxanthomonas indica TaxID=428993 RepID=A0A1T5ILW7_9GAMM|nr:glucokinase [Pseudoxanthomonas indica]SKC40135.1 glucokinase [Pseudoxanthomonas indica]